MFVHHPHLLENWQLKPRVFEHSLPDDFVSVEGWLEASVPGTVQQDLIAAGHIPNPFVGTNEDEVQWVGEGDWLYRCIFDLPQDFKEAACIDLCCEGLDTFATVWLNGTKILESDNMFLPQRVQVSPLLFKGKNQLHILFESALRRGKEREALYGSRDIMGDGDASRVYVRKAQYHYGWDWGPTLLTVGPWRAIYLEAYDVRIADLSCLTAVTPDLQNATLPVHLRLETSNGVPSSALSLHLALHSPTGDVIDEVVLPVTGYEMHHLFKLSEPQLWWPRGHGEQKLYRVVTTLHYEEENLDQRELRVGLHHLELIQQPLIDEPGTSFFFKVNNKPIFCGGADWIPADSFTPRISSERYQAWLRLAADANMTMVRVWGGGIYEENVFYDTCDELGLLVWQDFMFACGSYPTLGWFQESVRAEAEAAVRRLRHHPCIALWCGNNEDYFLAGPIGIYGEELEEDPITKQLPARVLYEHLLPEVCKRLDGTRSYWPGSPYGGSHANDPTQGNQHIWDVWHSNMANYHDYPTFGGRFVSEFGMQAFPVLATIKSFAPSEEQYPQSRTLDYHNKAVDGPRRLNVYLTDTVPIPADLEGYIYATQLVQAEAVASGIRGWRRRWSGPGRYVVSGALVWQLNDCWPVTSWALVDYELRPKPAYYVVRRELASLAAGIALQGRESAALWAVNDMSMIVEIEIVVRRWTLEGVLVDERKQSTVLSPNQATELGTVSFQSKRKEVLGVQLLKEGEIVSRATLWPEPFKYLTLPDPEIKIQRMNSTILKVHARRPAKGVWLEEGGDIRWSDNMLDLLPDDPQFIAVPHNLNDADIRVRSLR